MSDPYFRPYPKPAVRDKARPKRLGKNEKRAAAQFVKAFHSEDYVRFVHSLGCAVSWCRRTNIECAHVGSTRRNAGRWYEIAPLCTEHHREQEGRTHWFDKKYGTDLMATAAATALRFREKYGQD